MLNDRSIEKVTSFFFCSLLDDQLAMKASEKVLSEIDNSEDESEDSDRVDIQIVSRTYKYWLKYDGNQSLTRLSSKDWKISSKIDFSALREFKKTAKSDEFLALIWNKIAGISETNIARGLDIPIGTIRYRVGNGLKKLGQACEEPSLHV